MTVFIFGAGINRSIFDQDGLQPPLANDFFQLALKHSHTGSQPYRDKLQPLFDYIERYWKLTIEDLEHRPFDLESCYTLIQLQRLEAESRNDRLALTELEYQLTAFLAEYLSQFENFVLKSEEFMALGKILYSEKPAVLTFNYDTLVEYAIELASSHRIDIPASLLEMPPRSGKVPEVPDEQLTYSHFIWNRLLSYGVQFDEVQLHRPGPLSIVSGERFYSCPGNKFYDPPLLKLHGSINWFVYTGYTHGGTFLDDKAGKTVLYSGTWWFNKPPYLYGRNIKPLIVTPVVNKEVYRNSIISKLWDRAREILAACRRLVVAGYSFPPTDFHTRRLFLEAFSENTPEELVVIDPDTRVVQLVKELCHFRKPVLVCSNLAEFLTRYE